MDSEYEMAKNLPELVQLVKRVDQADGVELLTLALQAARTGAVLDYLSRHRNGHAAPADTPPPVEPEASTEPAGRRRRMSAATRAKLSEAMKLRHASGQIAKAKRAAKKRRKTNA